MGVFPLRVLVLSNNAGGLYRFRAELLEALIKEGHEVSFCVPEEANDCSVKKLTALGCGFLRTTMNRRGINPFDDARLVIRYIRVIREKRPDVVLSFTIKPNVYGAFAAGLFRVPIIITVTGLGTSFFSKRLGGIVRRLYKQACKQAVAVFFQNTSNKDVFLENRIVDLGKALLVPGSGVNVEKFKPTPKTKDDGVVRFLFIGRIMRDKGIEEYLHAAKELREKYPDTEFQILGPFEEEQYRIVIEQSNSAVVYLGVSDDVRTFIREADCIVHPSYHEGMSNVLLEGAAMGKPLIASNIPGCREVVEDGVNGFLFEPRSSESLARKLEAFLCLERHEWLIMGARSREKVARDFDRNVVVRAYTRMVNGIKE